MAGSSAARVDGGLVRMVVHAISLAYAGWHCPRTACVAARMLDALAVLPICGGADLRYWPFVTLTYFVMPNDSRR